MISVQPGSRRIRSMARSKTARRMRRPDRSPVELFDASHVPAPFKPGVQPR